MARAKDLTAFQVLDTVAQRLSTQITYPNITFYKPHAKQLLFHSHLHSKLKLFVGGNRSGKTYAGVSETVMRLIKDDRYIKFDYEGPTRGRVVGVDYDRGIDDIIIPYMKQFIPVSFLIDGSWEKSYNAHKHKLTLNNGSTCDFMTYQHSTDQFAGTSRHFIHFDEEPPEAIFKECLARLIDTNGVAYMTMTPVEGAGWLYDKYYEKAKDDENREVIIEYNANLNIAEAFYSRNFSRLLVVEVDMWENPHLNEEAQLQFLNQLDDEERATRQSGSFNGDTLKIFPNFNKHKKTVKEDFRSPTDYQRLGWQIYTSMDHGWTNPTVWLWHAVSPEGKIVTFHEMRGSKITVTEWAEKVHEYETLNGLDQDEIIRTGDPAIHQGSALGANRSGTSVFLEYAENDIVILTDTIPKDRSIGIIKMQQHLKEEFGEEPNWTIRPQCKGLIKELKAIKFAKHATKKSEYTNNKKEEVHKLNDHAFDAAKYFATFLPDLRPSASLIEKRKKEASANSLSGDGDIFSAMLLEVKRKKPPLSELTTLDDGGWKTIDWS